MNTQKKLYIWGIGDDCKRMLDRYPILNMYASCFIDSNSNVLELYGKKVVHPFDVNWNEPLQVIIATRKYYQEIAEYLNRQSLEVWNDYWGYDKAWFAWLASFGNEVILKRIFMLQETIKKLEKWFPDIYNKLLDKGNSVKKYIVEGNISPVELVVRCCCNERDKTIQLQEDVMFEYSDIVDLAVIVEELLMNEDYFFETDTEKPMIIDAGANVGLAIYYFKTIYPDARIIAFEPMPSIYEILVRNVNRNRWENVTVYPYAISDKTSDECLFYVQESGLAGSTEKRNHEGVDTSLVREIKVKSTCLSEYISENVEYLKMDIEGTETKAINEIKSKLHLINHIFVEFHEGQLKGENFLGEIVNLLEEKGFVVNVDKSYSSKKGTCFRPMNYVGKRISEVLWAKRM